jgi:hypothetical protein
MEGFKAFLLGIGLTESQFQCIADCLPRQRGNVGIINLQLLNALLYVVEHGCKWRGLPSILAIGIPSIRG